MKKIAGLIILILLVAILLLDKTTKSEVNLESSNSLTTLPAQSNISIIKLKEEVVKNEELAINNNESKNNSDTNEYRPNPENPNNLMLENDVFDSLYLTKEYIYYLTNHQKVEDSPNSMARCESAKCFNNEEYNVEGTKIVSKFCLSRKRDCISSIDKIYNREDPFAQYVFELSKTNLEQAKKELLNFVIKNYDDISDTTDLQEVMCEVVRPESCINKSEFEPLNTSEKTGMCKAHKTLCIFIENT